LATKERSFGSNFKLKRSLVDFENRSQRLLFGEREECVCVCVCVCVVALE